MTYRRNRKKGKAKYLLIIIIIGVVIGWYQYSRYQGFINTPVDASNDTDISFIIKKGESLNTITEKLSEKNLILDEDAFKMYSRLSGFDRKIVAGRFLLNQTLTVPEIIEVITSNKQSEAVLVVPEGSTILDIDAELAKLGVIEPREFIAAVSSFDDYDSYFFLDEEKLKDLPHPLEGYLFPDTYFIDPIDFYSENLIQLMLNTFEQRIGDELKTSDREIHDIVTMASIVEKEVRTTKDIPIVAGLLWKRIDNDWLLGADATLLYLKDDRTIDYQDLQEESPYNTRKNGGLPPGPIANPGLESLQATINPEESPYWYYLTTLDTGEVIYGKTNDEHNANKRKYLY